MRPHDHLLTVTRVMRLHAEALARLDQPNRDPPRPDCVEAALGSAWLAEGYADRPSKREGVIFACYIYIYLERRQCFIDGNKRAAWLAMTDVLYRLGLVIECSTEDALAMCLKIARSEVDAEGFILWVLDNLRDVD